MLVLAFRPRDRIKGRDEVLVDELEVVVGEELELEVVVGDDDVVLEVEDSDELVVLVLELVVVGDDDDVDEIDVDETELLVEEMLDDVVVVGSGSGNAPEGGSSRYPAAIPMAVAVGRKGTYMSTSARNSTTMK